MTHDRKDLEAANRASPRAQRWAARETERRAAAAADRARAEAERRPSDESEAPDRAAFLLGLLFLMLLLIAGWFVIDGMRCNPLFANISFAQARSCR